MEKKPATMDERMMAIFLESSSRYSLSRSFSSSTSSSSSSSSSSSLSELSSSGSSMLSSLGLSILYWKIGSDVEIFLFFYLFSQLLPNCLPLLLLFPGMVFNFGIHSAFLLKIHKSRCLSFPCSLTSILLFIFKIHKSVSPVFLFSLFFCKSSIAAVVIVTGKPRECLRI